MDLIDSKSTLVEVMAWCYLKINKKLVQWNIKNLSCHHLFQFQKAKELLEKGVSLWLPALKEAEKPEGAEVDPVQVLMVELRMVLIRVTHTVKCRYNTG